MVQPRSCLRLSGQRSRNQKPVAADYTLRISAKPIEIAPKVIVSTMTYNGQFPGPLLRFKEGQPVTVEIHNDTDTPGATALARAIRLDRRGWRGGRRHAFHSGARNAPNCVHSAAFRPALLSHA